jgi:cytochrome c-type biogenesis protein
MSLGSFIALYAGGLATFVSPCVLPMLPLYLGVLAGAQASASAETSKRRLRLAGVGFAVGLGLIFVLMGMGATALTQSLSGHRRMFEVGAGLVMMLFGAKLLGWLHLPWIDREARPLLNRVPNVGGFSGGLLFGAGFAVGWTPCVGPVLATALTYAASSTSSPLVAGAMLAVYALGLATPLVIASFAASRLLVLTQRLRKYTPAMQRATGALLLTLGALFATDQLSKLSPNFTSSTNCTESAACDAKIAATHTEISIEELPRGPALVEFVSGHCSICKKMHPLVSDLEQRCTRGLIVRVNVDDPSGRQLAAHYGVSMVPTFVSIDPSGGEVERIIGEQSKERLILALNDLGGKPCEQAM